MRPWWESWSGLFDAEIGAFKHHGANAEILNRDRGCLRLQVHWPRKGQPPVRLLVDVSPFHPFFRPAVIAPEEVLQRHQNPIDQGLCLLTQDTGQWNSNQLIADFLAERLPHLFSALAARAEGRMDDAAKLEEEAPDPISGYYLPNPENNGVVLFDGRMPVPKQQAGLAQFVYWQRPFFDGSAALEGVLKSVQSGDGRILRRFDLPFDPPLPVEAPGRWVRMQPPPTVDPQQLIAAAEAEISRITKLQPALARALEGVANQPTYFTALIFEEEVEYGHTGAGCVILFSQRNFAMPNSPRAAHLLRAERASEADVFARLPIANSLRSKQVLVVGCGAIGGFAAVELARAGVGSLLLLDRDNLQPGNSLRWPIGRTMWGVQKTAALKDFILRNYPWTKVESLPYPLGMSAIAPKDLNDLVGNADLVLDASASSEVQHALSYHVPRLQKPYVLGNATVGLAGGIVARFLPGDSMCFACLQNHLNDGTIPLASDDAGTVTPVGCNAPTFTGGAFDLQEVSMELVRTAVGILSGGKYDPGSWNVAVVKLKDPEGKRVLPQWSIHAVPPHSSCCGAPA